MRVLPALVISGLLLAACDDSEDALEPPDVNVRQRSELFSIGPRGVPRVALIIVDDSPTPEAQALRDIAADRFLEHYTATRRNVPDDCILAPDPGAPAEVHYRVILLAPSAGGEAAFRSFVDDPSLAWDAPRQLEPDAMAWSEAVARAIRDTKTLEPGSYQPLAVGDRWTQLLVRQLAPSRERERALLAALPGPLDVEVFVISTRDDESPLPAYGYDLTPDTSGPNNDIHFLTTYLLSDATVSCCDRDEKYLPRFAEQAWIGGRPDDPCSSPCAETPFFQHHDIADCRPQCFDAAPVITQSDSAECRVWALASPEGTCQDTAGWLDPLGPDGRRAPQG